MIRTAFFVWYYALLPAGPSLTMMWAMPGKQARLGTPPYIKLLDFTLIVVKHNGKVL